MIVTRKHSIEIKADFTAPNALTPKAFTKPSSYHFPAHKWHNIFQLLGIMVVANKRVFPEDMKAFLDSAIELASVVDPSITITRKMTKDWFLINKDELTQMVDSLAYDTAIISILSDIKSFPFKLDVMTCMVRIAIADGDYGDMEKMFIKKTILYWNIRAQDTQDAILSSTISVDA